MLKKESVSISSPNPNDGERTPDNEDDDKGRNKKCFSPVSHDYGLGYFSFTARQASMYACTWAVSPLTMPSR